MPRPYSAASSGAVQSVSSSDFLGIALFGGFTLCLLYVSVFIAYVAQVVMGTNYYFGVYRTDLPPPGPFVDDRYSYSWWFLMLDTVRVFVLPGLIWVFMDKRVRGKGFIIMLAFILLFIIDFFLVFSFLIMRCFFCNVGEFRNGLCDTVNRTAYCEAFWETNTDLCNTGITPPPIGSGNLDNNPIYSLLIQYTAAFWLLDFIVIIYLLLIRFIAPKTINAGYGSFGGVEEGEYDHIDSYVPPAYVGPPATPMAPGGQDPQQAMQGTSDYYQQQNTAADSITANNLSGASIKSRHRRQ